MRMELSQDGAAGIERLEMVPQVLGVEKSEAGQTDWFEMVMASLWSHVLTQGGPWLPWADPRRTLL